MIFEVYSAAIDPITLSILGLAISAIGTGYGIFSDYTASEDAYESTLKKLDHDFVFDSSLYSLQKKSLKKFYDFNTRENVISTNLSLGKQAVAMSKARIGTSGTFSPAYYAALYESDRNQRQLDLNFLDEVSKISIYQKSAKLAYENNISDNYSGLVATQRGTVIPGVLNIGSEIISTLGDIQSIRNKQSQARGEI